MQIWNCKLNLKKKNRKYRFKAQLLIKKMEQSQKLIKQTDKLLTIRIICSMEILFICKMVFLKKKLTEMPIRYKIGASIGITTKFRTI